MKKKKKNLMKLFHERFRLVVFYVHDNDQICLMKNLKEKDIGVILRINLSQFALDFH